MIETNSVAEGDKFLGVTELSGDLVSEEQVQRLCRRYYWASGYCKNKDVVEVACGTGQGLGILAKQAKSVVGGDISPEAIRRGSDYYGDRVKLEVMSAEALPFEPASKDVILIFEALYYIPDVLKFFAECRRVLKPGGVLLIATANKDLFDFNPSPFSHQYLGVTELARVLPKYSFEVTCYGDTPYGEVSWKQRLLRPVKRVLVDSKLMPASKSGKQLLKRFVFGKLVKMPNEVADGMAKPIKPTLLKLSEPDQSHKVIFCEAKRAWEH